MKSSPTLLALPASKRRTDRTAQLLCGSVLALALAAFPVAAADPPHTDGEYLCSNCHSVHHAAGVTLTSTAGNANLCLSCHVPAGTASLHSFVDGDQALPWPGLPAAATPHGTSHRWDSGAAGHVEFLGGTSTGTIETSGSYTGVYAKTFTLTIATSGNSGEALFNWNATSPGGGSGGNLAGTNVPLNEGVFVTFRDGTNVSFQIGDQWRIYVRPDLRSPTNVEMLARMNSGQLMCSTCHDQHSQALEPFDPAAAPYDATATNRHYMRVANDTDRICVDCHAARNVTNASLGSHPVGVLVPVKSGYAPPALLPLDKTEGQVRCSTCHQMHFAGATDGSLTRFDVTNHITMCSDCHRLANTNTPAAHLSRLTGVLWPGGQYGTQFPQITNAALRGSCDNCHQVHGWPNATNLLNHYSKLLVDNEEALCFTCHDSGGPAAKNVRTDFAKSIRHPLGDTDPLRRPGRTVECQDCHNPHQALSGAHNYSATATSTRNRVSNPLLGADGVAVNYSGLANFQSVATNRYTYIPKSTGATYEYQICLKCHSGYAWPTGSPPNGLSPNGTATTPVETDLAQEFSPMNKSAHPIVTGLNNYPNSAAPKSLTTAAMKAPWNVNVGTQTMMCSDCHNTDQATPAAQGPHGSAAQFMLRGANAANWPNVANSSFSTSWCANCHNNTSTTIHGGEHNSRRCYQCHIVIPHGGKMSRLIGDRNGTMPARYAWTNSLTSMGMTAFTKTNATSYRSSLCGSSSCGTSHGGSGATENW